MTNQIYINLSYIYNTFSDENKEINKKSDDICDGGGEVFDKLIKLKKNINIIKIFIENGRSFSDKNDERTSTKYFNLHGKKKETNIYE